MTPLGYEPPALMKNHLLSRRILVVLVALLLTADLQAADTGRWVIAQIPAAFAGHPSINNREEIVWDQQGGGIYSNLRGRLSSSGSCPHLSNSGEVVYADTFGGPGWDLVSTTCGRLTTSGIIDINFSDFDVQTNGEVVYAAKDTNNIFQIYSSIRGQFTFDATDHYNPCINSGEIIWNEYVGGAYGTVTISTTRGTLPGFYATPWDLNDSGELCYSGYLEGPQGNFTSPHVFSTAHGAVINDSSQFQWGGGMNDAGTVVWTSLGGIYMAKWVDMPVLSITPVTTGFALEWPTNFAGFHVQYTTNLTPPVAWQALAGTPTQSDHFFRQNVAQDEGAFVFFRLSTGSP